MILKDCLIFIKKSRLKTENNFFHIKKKAFKPSIKEQQIPKHISIMQKIKLAFRFLNSKSKVEKTLIKIINENSSDATLDKRVNSKVSL